MDMNARILSFAFAFLFLITAWLVYTTYMSVLPLETITVTFLNAALLLLVALIPYLLNTVVIGNPAIQDYSSSLFALDLAGILAILTSFAHILSREERGLVPPDVVRLFRNGRNRMGILSILVAISIAPTFWTFTLFDVPLRIYMWTLPLISYWAGRALSPQSRTYRLT